MNTRTMMSRIAALLALVTASLVWPMREARRDAVLRLAPGVMRAALDDVVKLPMLVSVFFGLGSGTVFAFMPTFAEDLGVTTLSLFYTGYAASAIAVRIAGGRLIDTRGRRAVIVPSMFVQASGTQDVAQSGQSVFVDDVVTQGQYGSRASVTQLRLRSLCCVPLVHSGRILGLCYTDSTRPCSVPPSSSSPRLMNSRGCSWRP